MTLLHCCAGFGIDQKMPGLGLVSRLRLIVVLMSACRHVSATIGSYIPKYGLQIVKAP
jgi:hypothetical protein